MVCLFHPDFVEFSPIHLLAVPSRVLWPAINSNHAQFFFVWKMYLINCSYPDKSDQQLSTITKYTLSTACSSWVESELCENTHFHQHPKQLLPSWLTNIVFIWNKCHCNQHYFTALSSVPTSYHDLGYLATGWNENKCTGRRHCGFPSTNGKRET